MNLIAIPPDSTANTVRHFCYREFSGSPVKRLIGKTVCSYVYRKASSIVGRLTLLRGKKSASFPRRVAGSTNRTAYSAFYGSLIIIIFGIKRFIIILFMTDANRFLIPFVFGRHEQCYRFHNLVRIYGQDDLTGTSFGG